MIALAADFRVCTPAARFAFLFTKVGLSGGDMGAAYLLPRLVGLGHATRLLMLGDTVYAEEAARIGLVSYLVDKDAFDDKVDALARRLASGPVQAYAQTKALLTREQDMSLSAAIELEAVTQALLMKGEDYAEFHAAFNAAARRSGRAADGTSGAGKAWIQKPPQPCARNEGGAGIIEVMNNSSTRRFPVTVTHLPVTRCQICHRTVAYRPGNPSEVLTEHYRRAHPEVLGLPPR